MLQQQELAIDDEIDQRIDEIVDAAHAQAGAGLLQPLAHRREDVVVVVVEADDVVAAEKNADLPRLQPSLDPARIVHDQECLIVERIELRALVAVEHVLQRQRMQIELLAQHFQHVGARPAGDVDPGPFRRRQMPATLVDRHLEGGLALLFVVLHQREMQRARLAVVAPGQRSRRRTRWRMAFRQTVHGAPLRCSLIVWRFSTCRSAGNRLRGAPALDEFCTAAPSMGNL